MSWALLDDNFPSHPKVVQAGPVAAFLYVCGLCYCRKHHTDGFIPSGAVRSLGVTTNPKRLVEALIAVKLWDVAADGYQIHDYAQMYDDAEAKDRTEEKRRRRQEAGRKGGLARASNASSKNQAIASSEIQPHRDGMVLPSSHSLEEKEEGDDIDAQASRLMRAYPPQGSASIHAVTAALRMVLHGQPKGAFDALMQRLEGHKRSARWAKNAGEFIPRLDNYLKNGIHGQVMPSAEETQAAEADKKLPAWLQRANALKRAGAAS